MKEQRNFRAISCRCFSSTWQISWLFAIFLFSVLLLPALSRSQTILEQGLSDDMNDSQWPDIKTNETEVFTSLSRPSLLGQEYVSHDLSFPYLVRYGKDINESVKAEYASAMDCFSKDFKVEKLQVASGHVL